MKSDVIRKRSRHDARRSSNAGATGVPSSEDNPPISPGVSQRTSPAGDPSPTLAPDSTTALNYDYTQDHLIDTFGTNSELVGALGQDPSSAANLFQNTYQYQYPGPYHSDYLLQMYTAQIQAAAAAGGGGSTDGLGGFGSPSVGVLDLTAPSSTSSGTSTSSSGTSPVPDQDLPTMSPRSMKRRKMSMDSASEPPSSTVSSFSFGDAYSPSSSVSSSARSPMEFAFSSFTTNARNTAGVASSGPSDAHRSGSSGPVLRGSVNTFWHPPMMPQNDDHPSSSPHLGFHQPLLPPSPSLNKTLAASITPASTSSSPSSSINAGGSACGNARREMDSPEHHTGGLSTSSSVEGGESEDSPMDYLHPSTLGLSGGMGVIGPDDDSLFSAYLHPPMVVHSEDSPTCGSAIVA